MSYGTGGLWDGRVIDRPTLPIYASKIIHVECPICYQPALHMDKRIYQQRVRCANCLTVCDVNLTKGYAKPIVNQKYFTKVF